MAECLSSLEGSLVTGAVADCCGGACVFIHADGEHWVAVGGDLESVWAIYLALIDSWAKFVYILLSWLGLYVHLVTVDILLLLQQFILDHDIDLLHG